jgi:hypothetical protein
MKKSSFLFTALTLLISYPLLSQESIVKDDESSKGVSPIVKPLTKGNFMLGGAVDFYYSSSNGASDIINTYSNTNSLRQVHLSLNPSVGYFVIDGLVLGLTPTFTYEYARATIRSLGTSNGTSDGHSFNIGLNAFAKYYFKNSFFIGLESGYSHKIGNYNDAGTTKDNNFIVRPSIGYAIFLNSKVSIEPSIYYLYQKYDLNGMKFGTSSSSSNNIGLSVGLHIFR